MSSLLLALATSQPSHGYTQSAGAVDVSMWNLVPMWLRGRVSGTEISTQKPQQHVWQSFSWRSHSMLPALCKCNLSNLPAPKPKDLVQKLLTINQFLTLQAFGIIIPTLYIRNRTNRWNVHSQINTNLLSICYVSFWHVPAQGAKRNTSQSWEPLPAHRVPRAEASAALSIQAKVTEPDFPQMLCTFPSSQCQPSRHSSRVHSIMLKNSNAESCTGSSKICQEGMQSLHFAVRKTKMERGYNSAKHRAASQWWDRTRTEEPD